MQRMGISGTVRDADSMKWDKRCVTEELFTLYKQISQIVFCFRVVPSPSIGIRGTYLFTPVSTWITTQKKLKKNILRCLFFINFRLIIENKEKLFTPLKSMFDDM